MSLAPRENVLYCALCAALAIAAAVGVISMLGPS